MRLFIVIPMPDGVTSALSRIQQGVPNARWVPGRNMHLTLRFLGESDGAAFEDLIEALAEVVVEPFEIAIEGMGHFEVRKQPTVLWAGVSASPPLARLQRKVEMACQRAGFAPERRKFAPHITLARFSATDPVRVSAFLQRYSLFQAGSVAVDGFSVYSSHLGKGDPIYRAEVDYWFQEPVA